MKNLNIFFFWNNQLLFLSNFLLKHYCLKYNNCPITLIWTFLEK